MKNKKELSLENLAFTIHASAGNYYRDSDSELIWILKNEIQTAIENGQTEISFETEMDYNNDSIQKITWK